MHFIDPPSSLMTPNRKEFLGELVSIAIKRALLSTELALAHQGRVNTLSAVPCHIR